MDWEYPGQRAEDNVYRPVDKDNFTLMLKEIREHLDQIGVETGGRQYLLTIATGNPAYYPWVADDNPESGNGFEAARAYASGRVSLGEAKSLAKAKLDILGPGVSVTVVKKANKDHVVDVVMPMKNAALGDVFGLFSNRGFKISVVMPDQKFNE